jgi:hypothetical protein
MLGLAHKPASPYDTPHEKLQGNVQLGVVIELTDCAPALLAGMLTAVKSPAIYTRAIASNHVTARRFMTSPPTFLPPVTPAISAPYRSHLNARDLAVQCANNCKVF